MAEEVGREVSDILRRSLPLIWPELRLAPEFFRRMETFAALLARWGKQFNLTARPEDPAALAFHITDCASLLALQGKASCLRGCLDSGREVADIGSGCGFPGVVLASGCAARVVLFERRRKRAAFLRIVVAALSLDNAEVSTTALPNAQVLPRFDAAVGRAVALPEEFFSLAHGVLSEGGVAILYATRNQEIGLARARRLGFCNSQKLDYQLGPGVKERTGALNQRKTANSSDRALIIRQKVTPCLI